MVDLHIVMLNVKPWNDRMKKIKNIIIVSVFLIGAISGFLFFELQENAEAIKPYNGTTTSEVVDYIKENNLS